MKKHRGLLIVAFLFLISIKTVKTNDSNNIESTSDNFELIVNEEDAKNVKDILHHNLIAVNEQDINGYLDTIVKSGHQDTEEMMVDFFKTHKIKQSLLKFEIEKQTNNEIIVRSKQKITGTSTLKEDYRNHIAEILHVFVREDNSWKIKESSMTEIEFIE